MANSRFSSRNKIKRRSGISNETLPDVLKYPNLINFDTHGEVVRNIFSCIFPHYGYDGLSVLIYRQPKPKENVVVLCGDWLGNKLDIVDVPNPSRMTELASEFLTNDAIRFFELFNVIGIAQAQLFFAIDDDGLLLVDVQLSLNKFASPGMVKDIFGKVYRTPNAVKIEMLDDRAMEYIGKASGSYEGDLIIKPNNFRMFYDENTSEYSPMYIEVIR